MDIPPTTTRPQPLLYPTRLPLSLTSSSNITLLTTITSPPPITSPCCSSRPKPNLGSDPKHPILDGYVYIRENSLELNSNTLPFSPPRARIFYYDKPIMVTSGRRISGVCGALDPCGIGGPCGLECCYKVAEFCVGSEGEYVEVREHPQFLGICCTSTEDLPCIVPRGCGGKGVKVRVSDGKGAEAIIKKHVMEGRMRLL